MSDIYGSLPFESLVHTEGRSGGVCDDPRGWVMPGALDETSEQAPEFGRFSEIFQPTIYCTRPLHPEKTELESQITHSSLRDSPMAESSNRYAKHIK